MSGGRLKKTDQSSNKFYQDFDQCRKETYHKVSQLIKDLKHSTGQQCDMVNIIKMWLDFNSQKRTKKMRRDGIYQQTNHPEDIDNIEYFFEKASLFDEPTHWFWRITDQFVKNVNMIDLIDLLTVMQLTMKGYFQEGNKRVTKIIPDLTVNRLQQCFSQKYKQKFVILFEVVLDIYPVFDQVYQFAGFEYRHSMVFYNIFPSEKYNEKLIFELTQQYLDSQSEHHIFKKYSQTINPNNYGIPNSKPLFENDYSKQQKYYKMVDISEGEKIMYSCIKDDKKLFPQDIRQQYVYCDKQEAWIQIKQNELNNQIYKKYNLQQINQQFYSELNQQLNGEILNQILEKISLNFQLTDKQKEIVGAQGNILVLGRSGTGKTTCTLLKMAAQQQLFEQKINAFKKQKMAYVQRQGISETDLDNNLVLKSVFATASPVLANELKVFYKKLRNKIFRDDPLQGQYDQQDLTDSDEDELKYVADLNRFDRFEQMAQNDFPLFLTIRKLIFLIDGSLYRPFFDRNKKKRSQQNNQIFKQWHNESNGVLRLDKLKKQNQKYDDELFNSQNLIDYDQMLANKQNLDSKSSKEVTYEVFLEEFWPNLQQNYESKIRIQKTKGLTPGFLWTHIYSYIKGSMTHFDDSSITYRTKESYRYLQNIRFTIKEDLLDLIYDLFLKYEQWKTDNKYYDLMDAVNYIQMNIKKSYYSCYMIHYLFIDEIQDLPDNIILLLTKVTQFSTIFSGDTAQNIAKGLEFRSNNLNQLLQYTQCNRYTNPNYMDKYQNLLKFQLKKNFRSHNNILQLANSVVNLLELCFPSAIDILQKEKSDLEGPKPIIINSQEALFLILNNKDQQTNVQFGSNQVIIVKNQESKQNIPELLKHALILTIYEAKGLDFHDVILYNFFNDTTDQWDIFNQLIPEEQTIHKQTFKNLATNQKKRIIYEKIFKYKKINDQYLVKKYKFKQQQLRLQFKEQRILCNELKQLYVAITRARKRLIIYDENPQNRQALQNIWSELQLVDIYSQNDIPMDLQQSIQQITSEEWNQQGNQLFKNKFYLQAMRCYALSGDEYLLKKANAYQLAEEATILLAENGILEKKQTKQQKSDLQNKMKKNFKDASQLFIQINKPKYAAQCLYSAGDYIDALQIYENMGWIKEAAEAAYQCKLYKKSGDLFIQINDHLRALDAYETAQDWEGIFQVVLDFKNRKEPELVVYLNKYLPLVFTQLQDKFDKSDPQQEKQNEFKVQLLEINEKDENDESDKNDENDEKDENEVNDANQEEVEEGDDEDDEDVENGISKGQVKQQDRYHIKQMDQSEQGIIIDMADEQNDEQQILVQQSRNDFSIISQEQQVKTTIKQNLNQSDSFIVDISQQLQQNDFEHLSNYDLDDYWLKSDSKSVIESIQSQLATNTEFSALSLTQIFNDPNIQLIKTKCNIYIQDELMKQIIKWISVFQNEFKQQLNQQIREKSQNNDLENIIDVILDLDQVEIEFIHFVLDVLEYFQLFKLCIFVCNRYKLINKLTKYIVSIGAQYSPILVDPIKILKGTKNNLNKHKQKGTVASFAMHSVFENINMQLVLSTNQNQLHEQLIMLGYWKKIVYQLSIEDALNIFSAFQDYKNWKNVYFSNVICQLQLILDQEEDQATKNIINGRLLVMKRKQKICFITNPQDLFYFDLPSNKDEELFILNSLEQIYTELIYGNTKKAKIKLPQILVNTEELWNSVINNSTISEELIGKVCSNFNTNAQSFQIYESSLFLITFVKYINQNQDSKVSQQYSKEYSNKTIILIKDCLQLILNSINIFGWDQGQTSPLLNSILLLNKIKLSQDQLFQNYRQYAIIKRDSVILEKLLKKKGTLSYENVHFIDVDFEFILAPIKNVLTSIQKQFKIEFQTLQQQRSKQYQFQKLQMIECRDFQIESLATIISNRFHVNIEEQYSNHHISRNENNINLLFGNQDNSSIMNYLNELLNCTMSSNYNCQMLPTIKVKLLEIALQCFRQFRLRNDEDHDVIVKGILLMNFIDKNNYSYLFIDQISKTKPELKYYKKYLEYLICRKYNIISDATECYFEYHHFINSKLNVDEILNDLTYLFVNQIITLKQKVLLPQILINYFDDINGFELKQPIYQINVDQLNYTISFLIQNFDKLIEFAPQQVISIFTTYILNIENIPNDIIESLQGLNNNEIQFLTNNIRFILTTRILNICPQMTLSNLGNQQVFEFVVVNRMDIKQLENNYQDCMNEWEGIDKLNYNTNQIINKLITQRQKINKAINQNEQILSDQHRTRQQYNQQWNMIQESIVSLRRNLIQLIYKIKLESDFHQIYQILIDLNQFEESHKSIKGNINLKEIDKRQLQDLEKKAAELQSKNLNLKDDMIIKQKKLDDKNKELLRMKWVRQTAGIATQAIQKKKAEMMNKQVIQAIGIRK